jgi:polysaccharide deacetylase family protein (PEP-CTERM system associated)
MDRMVTRHHFTVDVEEHFQVSAFERSVLRSDWDRQESRVAGNVTRLLELLERFAARATFFVLGCVAERHPGMIREIAAGRHEVASHGWGHRRATDLSSAEFREDVRSSKHLLEDLAGEPVLGYRAPSFSIVPGREWALDVLIEEGYRYDSSLFPVRRSGYGYPNGGRDPYWLMRPAGRLAEFPPATLRLLGLSLPAGGGAYFRLFPPILVRAALRACERRGVPATFYIHPWELDPDQPRVDVRWPTRLRHYGGLGRVSARLERLLDDFAFVPIRDTLRVLSSPVMST